MAIIERFRGGFKDGLELRSDSDNPNEGQEALELYTIHDNGSVGKRFKALSEAGIAELKDILIADGDNVRLKREPSVSMNHIYQIVARDEIEEDVIVTYEYQGQI